MRIAKFAALSLLTGCLSILGSSCSERSTNSGFAVPEGCNERCDGLLADVPSALDIVNVEIDELGNAQVTLAWKSAADESKVAEYWIGRGSSPATEANLVTRVPLGVSQIAVPLEEIATSYFVASVDARGAILGISASVTAHQTVQGRYEFAASVPGLDELSQVEAQYWAPDNQSEQAHPIVFLLHGNHGTCRVDGGDACIEAASCSDVVDNAGGYDYLGQTLAAKGYIAVSLNANAHNCRPGFITERAELILLHLEQWRSWQEGTQSFPGEGNLAAIADLGRVGLFGHSRGAEAVVSATQLLAERRDIFSYVDDVSVISLAPTDINEQPVVDASLLMVLPGCDGDVTNLSGQDIWNRSALQERTHDLYQVVIPGASHNLFNREWLGNDNNCAQDEHMSRASQEATLSVLAASWFDSTLSGNAPSEALPRASLPEASRGGVGVFPRVDSWAGQRTDLRWSFASASSLRIEDAAEDEIAAVNEVGGANAYLDLDAEVLFSPGRNVLSLYWDGNEPIIRHELGGLDASEFAAVSLLAAVEIPEIEAKEVSFNAVIRIFDTSNRVAKVDLDSIGGLQAQASGRDQYHVQRTIRLPLEVVLAANPELDWSSLASIEVDLAASGVPMGLWQHSNVELTR
tara:strand:+ start:112045 stop:113946 length:1902 start_codon:yes stop_codon:yes gene_type:complete